jgi:hypothetical protein
MRPVLLDRADDEDDGSMLLVELPDAVRRQVREKPLRWERAVNLCGWERRFAHYMVGQALGVSTPVLR